MQTVVVVVVDKCHVGAYTFLLSSGNFDYIHLSLTYIAMTIRARNVLNKWRAVIFNRYRRSNPGDQTFRAVPH